MTEEYHIQQMVINEIQESDEMRGEIMSETTKISYEGFTWEQQEIIRRIVREVVQEELDKQEM